MVVGRRWIVERARGYSVLSFELRLVLCDSSVCRFSCLYYLGSELECEYPMFFVRINDYSVS
jgi:hypothetical protein